MGCEWRDFRLANMSSDSWSPPPEMHIWKPSIEVVMKEESGESHPVVSVSPEGNVLQMRWYTLKVTCLMQLQAYPLDRQKCSVLFNIRKSRLFSASSALLSVTMTCGWDLWMGLVDGTCGWDLWMGLVDGACGWDLWMGLADGTCGWDLWMGLVDGTCGWDMWMGLVDGTCGWDLWMGLVDGTCGWDLWMGLVDGTCGWDLWMGLVDGALGGARILWGWSTYWFPGATPVVTRTSGLHSQLQLETVETFAYVNSLVLPEAICVYEGGACDYGETENCLRKQCTSVERITSQECRTCNYFSGVCHNGTVQDCDSLQAVTQGDQVFTTGELRFTLTRRLSYHLLQTYIPSISIVAMSWISFWLNKDAAPARTALGVTTVLTMITQSGRTEAMPEVSYVRAVDVWLLVCQLFVFLALIEYASVNYISRTIRAKVDTPSEPTENCSFFKVQEDCQNQNHLETPVKVTKMDGRQIAEKIDEISKMLFPLSFLLFNLLYWSVYFFVVR
ncbi:uncharacterized protein LOC118417412 [Branchiostoma floridae]|uniref:Uncharacterized protein LOC118417412 n=1 Tax=Branchiostoma floridae TaxID=7739 RepID=A0A9J7LC38_BRAFL|nr:uncharacterized protein LOC118417412 [Branchiostoma floridae]